MDYIGPTEEEQAEMLKILGVKSVEELLSAVPKSLFLPEPQEDGLTEREGIEKLTALAKKNTFSNYTSYLGGGAYDHFIPSYVAPILSRSEFLTSYTPYQPELSQGMLQALFEYQTVVTRLTGLEVANASLYDGSTACAEALLLALRVFKGERRKVLVAKSLNPRYQSVLDLYLTGSGGEKVLFSLDDEGMELIQEDVAAVLIPYPNYFGELVDPKPFFQKAKEKGALSIHLSHPIALALFESSGELGADLAVGDGQPLGLPLQFGGPYVGYMAAKKEFIREIPGRIIGETVDKNDKRCFVLTLQAREQHIRREKATSNICTSQSLAAIAFLLTVLWYGGEGLKNLALENYHKAKFLKEELLKIKGFKDPSSAPHFNEFLITFSKPLKEILPRFEQEKIIPGIEIDTHTLLIAVTEKRSMEDLHQFIQVCKEL